MVKNHSDRERGNPLPPHGLLFPISSKGSFICITHRQDNTYHILCYTSRGALAGTKPCCNNFKLNNNIYIFNSSQSICLRKMFSMWAKNCSCSQIYFLEISVNIFCKN